jgi:hypothetical protein
MLAGAGALAVPLATSAPAQLSRSAAGNEPVVPAATVNQWGVRERLFERAITCTPNIRLQKHMSSAERLLGCSPSFAAQIAGSVLRLTAGCSVVLCYSGPSTAASEKAIGAGDFGTRGSGSGGAAGSVTVMVRGGRRRGS